MRLTREAAGSLPAAVNRGWQGPTSGRRIVHLGIGTFHRAHQAVYTQDAGDGWRITGVSLRSPEVRDALMPQGGLYTVTQRFSGSAATRLVTVVDTVLVAPEDAEAVIAALADPQTHVVTLTVTEKGYYRHPATGALRRDDPAIAGDLNGAVPRTLYGYLAQALGRRRAAGANGITLVSCDNLPGNGALLMSSLSEFLDEHDPDLAAWARDHVAAPDTMVDRIVPASTAAQRAEIAAAIGMEDAAAIITEPFSQWVIEDRFAGPRPTWEVAGAQMVEDVAPFELAKLRLLNASHSALAYMGLQIGYTYVHQAIEDSLLRAFVERQMRDEAVSCLIEAPGLNPVNYMTAILNRFANADLHHRLDQIAMDGSQKLPQRWIQTIAQRARRGLQSPCHLTSLAAWIAYTASPLTADDPLAADYQTIWASSDDPIKISSLFVKDLGIFPTELQNSAGLLDYLGHALGTWRERGPHATVSALLA